MNPLDIIRIAYEEGRRHEDQRTHSGQVWFLEEPEIGAERAAEEAGQAVLAAERGDWNEALNHARRAWAFEESEYGHCRNWRPLWRAVQAACQFHPLKPPKDGSPTAAQTSLITGREAPK